MDDPRRILVRLPNWVGDVVMATPGLRALRARYPDAEITAHVRPGLDRLLAGSPQVDRIEPVRSWHRGARALLGEARALRARGFGLGICLPDSFSSAILMRAAGVSRVVGYRRGGRAPLLHVAVAPRSEWGRRRLVARERYVLHLLDAIGCPGRGTELELATTPEEEAAADAVLAGVERGRRILALAPGASYGPAKRWSPAAFAAVADAFDQAGLAIAIVGSPGEAPLGRAIVEGTRCAPLDLCGRTDLGVLKAVLRRADALVCNDAGARHIATALGTPAIVLFGPTAVEKTDCNLQTVEVVETGVSCRPCYRRECPIDHRCMTRIDPAHVIARTRAALSGA